MMFLIIISSFLLSSDDCGYFDSKFKASFPYSFSIYDIKKSKTIKSCNKDMLLVPASAIKILTSVYAFEKLGVDYRFKTEIALTTEPQNFNLIIKGGGDFTLGSENFSSSVDNVAAKIVEILKEKGIKRLEKVYIVNQYKSFPDGSVEWQDLGNYYATSVSLFSINDNSYKIHFKTYEVGKPAMITRVEPDVGLNFTDMVVSEASSDDNAYIQSNPYSSNAVISGSLPAMKEDFVIKGALFHPDSFFADFLCGYLKKNGFDVDGCYAVDRYDGDYKIIYTFYSPPLLQIVSFMNEKSFNFYADSLLHFAMIKDGIVSYEKNIYGLSCFLREIGITNFYIKDGSGLSRRNLFSADGFIKVLNYAYHSPYFEKFYLSLTSSKRFVLNNTVEVRLKSGSMNRVRSWCGYIRVGKRVYAFSFIFNNYPLKPSEIESAVIEYLKRFVQSIS